MELAIPNFQTYKKREHTRSSCSIGRCRFRHRLLVYPAGSNAAKKSFLCAYVEATPPPHLGPEWKSPAMDTEIAVVNFLRAEDSLTKIDSNFIYGHRKSDRGWHDMIKLSHLTQERGWLNENGAVVLKARCWRTVANP